MTKKEEYFCDICNESADESIDICYKCKSKAKGLKSYNFEEKSSNIVAYVFVTSIVWIFIIAIAFIISLF